MIEDSIPVRTESKESAGVLPPRTGPQSRPPSRLSGLAVAMPVVALALLLVMLALAQPFAEAASTLQPLQTWAVGKPIEAVAVSPKGHLLAVGMRDRGIELRRMSDGAVVSMLVADGQQAGSRVTALAFSPDGHLLATVTTASRNGDPSVIRLWKVSDGTLIASTPPIDTWVWALAFSPDGQWLASGGHDRIVHMWQMRGAQSDEQLHVQLARKLRGRPAPSLGNADVIRLAFNNDGTTLTAGNGDDTVLQWRVADGKQTLTGQGYTHQTVSIPYASKMAFDPGMEIAATAAAGSKELYIWRLDGDRLIQELKGHASTVASLAFSPDGKSLASGGGAVAHRDTQRTDTAIRVWSVSDGREQVRLVGHSAPVGALAWSPDGKLLVSGSEDGTVRLWQVR